MKRFTIVLLALALCGSFTACSNEKTESVSNEDNAAVGVADPGKDNADASKPVGDKKEPDAASEKDKPSDKKPSQNAADGAASEGTQEPQTQTDSTASNQATQQSQPQGTTSIQSHPNQSQTITMPTPEPEIIPETQPVPDNEMVPEPQPTPAPQPATEPQPTPASQPVTEPQPTPASQPATEPQPAPEPAAPTLEQAGNYVGSSASALEGALGSPASREYSPSCMGEGEDGIWVYDGFTVYTYRENGVETVEAVR